MDADSTHSKYCDLGGINTTCTSKYFDLGNRIYAPSMAEYSKRLRGASFKGAQPRHALCI
jgi:hypothetical protein